MFRPPFFCGVPASLGLGHFREQPGTPIVCQNRARAQQPRRMATDRQTTLRFTTQPLGHGHSASQAKNQIQKIAPLGVGVCPHCPEPERFPPERLTPERHTPERLTPERLTPDRFTPERLAPERLSPERLTLEPFHPRAMLEAPQRGHRNQDTSRAVKFLYF